MLLRSIAYFAVPADERHGENVIAQLQRLWAADAGIMHTRQVPCLLLRPHFDLRAQGVSGGRVAAHARPTILRGLPLEQPLENL